MSQIPTPPFPLDVYQELEPARCPAGHPPAIIAARACSHCQETRRRYGMWPSYCQICHTERIYRARKQMERDGRPPVCLPMYTDRLGQHRKESEGLKKETNQ